MDDLVFKTELIRLEEEGSLAAEGPVTVCFGQKRLLAEATAFCALIGAAYIDRITEGSDGRIISISYGAIKVVYDCLSGKASISSPIYADPLKMSAEKAVVTENDVIFLPVTLFAKAFDLTVKTNLQNRIISVTAKKAFNVYFVPVPDENDDHGAVIQKVLDLAAITGGNGVMLFPAGTKYYLNEEVKERFAYFRLNGLRNFAIEGNGSQLLLNRKNSAFKITGCDNVAVRSLDIDHQTSSFFQGIVLEKDGPLSFTARAHEGSALPPDNGFVAENGWPWAAGAGLHGLVFYGGNEDNSKMAVRKSKEKPPYHFRCKLIEKIDGVKSHDYRFTLCEPSILESIEPGDKITYGLSLIHMTSSEVDLKIDSGYSETIDITGNTRVMLEDVNVFSSLSMGIRIADNDGKITLRRTNVCIKPGSERLLSTPSDGIHTKNNRTGITLDNCLIESTGDDNLNISTMLENVVEQISPCEYQIKSVDVRIFTYKHRKGDVLTFYDLLSNKIISNAIIVNDPVYDPSNNTWRVVLDRPVHLESASENGDDGKKGKVIKIMNQNQRASGTVIKNCTFRPVYRNSVFGNFDGGTIENNIFDGSRGGIIGLNFCGDADVKQQNVYGTHVLAFSNNVRITENKFYNYQWNAILQISTEIRDENGSPVTRDISVKNNFFRTSRNNVLVFSNINNLSEADNLILPSTTLNQSILIKDCIILPDIERSQKI